MIIFQTCKKYLVTVFLFVIFFREYNDLYWIKVFEWYLKNAYNAQKYFSRGIILFQKYNIYTYKMFDSKNKE